MKVFIDQDKCVGAGQCVLAADEVFDQRDEDGVAFLLAEQPDDRHRAATEDAARVCPAAAIRVEG
ncbi:ferredoxin [Saccharopolyspora endophytica]|uniref:Ferredoxin n=1 Tax=Saccharopolyspora endophytica TaxID=543886 RepID=A0ABS5DKZ7_9PSEU|nr:ferredoxin [Saccharopolyspora endophytica]MBQ0926959.1 ferredoxin [Saccharopolyspora endophytica]